MNNLARAVYHEAQEAGSMLCAQHALNSLLQGNYFTAPDLSVLAKELDTLEESHDDDNHGTRSGNMDDTGFFSLHVLENALKVWGFGLTRWRSEEMRPLHDHPDTQLAFILNYEQHWFTLRRFGPHWFNLNSFSARPEWVSKLYLGMVLQQAEADGYSVFVVTPLEPSTTALPHSEADAIAMTVAEPSSASPPDPHTFSSQTTGATPFIEGMEDEDYELQAALHASMMGDIEAPPPVIRSSVDLPSSESAPESTDADIDPVAASMERNRRALEQMKAEQEHAQRQLWSEGGHNDDTEDEMLRRAIEESESPSGPEPQVSMGSHVSATRVYDDDDAELQAALKASLEEVPVGWTIPELAVPHVASGPSTNEEPVVEEPPTIEEVSVDELRRRRLARFGA
ncbi:Josephin-domain-containing protein [Mycena amicta]|nr:Josephin-domain-containing protein [Mycena amicta]